LIKVYANQRYLKGVFVCPVCGQKKKAYFSRNWTRRQAFNVVLNEIARVHPCFR